MEPKKSFFLLFVIIFEAVNCQLYLQPEQLHLSYPDDPTKMTVTWSTHTDTNASICEYGISSLDMQATGYRTLFVDGGKYHRSQVIHHVVLTDLKPGKKYWYHCGSIWGWSDMFFFKALKSGTKWSPKLALFGDLGNVNGRSLPYLQRETQNGDYDAILHVGDFAYNMDTNNAHVGDEFMRQIEPIAAYAPYMTCVGNHEQNYNFSNYKNRFVMPHDDGSNMFFSFDIGPVHFISISTEYYFFTNYGLKQIVNQYKWLEKDLKKATHPNTRSKRPWIIIFGHRPMYCSNNDDKDCTIDSIVRVGIPVLHMYGIEALLYKYGVDVALWAHEHSYERLWPVFNKTVLNGSLEEPYTDPKATVHITTGSAGCQEDLDGFIKDPPPWTAFRASEYGYTKLHIHNSTHLYFEQIAVEKNGQVIDSFWVKKNLHDSFTKLYPGQFDVE
ncbi:hypothetical protein CHUAL_009463 [Chamberlinius hualienensis]